MVDVNKIINVDFSIVSTNAAIGSYKTVAYLVACGIKDSTNTGSGNSGLNYKLCKSFDDVKAAADARTLNSTNYTAATTIESAKVFFDNGGSQLLLIQCSDSIEVPAMVQSLGTIQDILSGDDKFIYLCVSKDSESILGSTKMASLVAAAEVSKAPHIFRLLLTDISVDAADATAYKDNSVGVKLCTKKVSSLTPGASANIDGALLIGAYYSKVNLDGGETIKDYCYTPETIAKSDGNSVTDNGCENVTSTQYDSLISKNVNFIDRIGSNIVNFGGNLANGVNIHTDFGTCAIENDVTNAVLKVMLNKQYLTPAGLNNIISAINSAIVRYKNNGYLELGSVYSGDTYVYSYNGAKFTIIKKGTSLSQGYLVTAIPMANLSDADREARKFTPIFVIMQTAYGARIVEIRGEVR